MHLRTRVTASVVSLIFAVSVSVCFPVDCSAQNSNVSMVSLQTVPGQNGQQYVVSPKGMTVPLPGAGVNSNTVQIYMGSQGGYWYVDKTGQSVDLTPYVARYKSMAGQSGYPQAQAPQYAPAPTQSSESSSSGGSGGAATALAAGAAGFAGAMAGSAMTNSYWNNVPYGTPYAYNAAGHPYYVDKGGNNVYVNNSNTANVSANSVHANSLQTQQQWYDNQVRTNSERAQGWQNQTDNPFVHANANTPGGSDSARKGRFGRNRGSDGGGTAGSTGDGGGRFGGRGDGGGTAGSAGDGGGRFGGRGDGGGTAGGAGDGGGRFGGRGDGGGLSGGRAGGAGGRFGGRHR